MQLSIIILNYNVRYFLELCLISVKVAIENLDAEIIVVDNNSTDGSCQMLKDRFPEILLIENKLNLGFPKGNNIGVAAAKGKYICILNPDTVVAEDTFIKILQPANWTLKTGIIGCKLIDGSGNFLPESKRGVPTPFVAFTKIFALYKISNIFGKYYAQHLKENQSGKVDILVGAFMVMKRELYIDVGGFDENCFMYSDDIDLSYMITEKGYYNYYYHETSVIHFKGESTIKDGTYMKRFQDAMNFFYKKHFKISILFQVFMKIGIVFFAFIKKFQGKPKIKHQAEKFVLVSDNMILSQKLQILLKKPLKRIDLAKSFSEIKNSDIILDNNYLDFKTIITIMETNTSNNIRFKILPKHADYLIGSDDSNDRGTVIPLNFRF